MTLHLDNPESCFVCRRRADGLGVERQNRIGWLCQQCADGGYGTRMIRMPVREFDEYEQTALVRASQGRAGEFLDRVGTTDLVELQPEQWQHVCRLVIEDFGDAIRREVGGGLPAPATPDQIRAHQSTEEIEADEVP